MLQDWAEGDSLRKMLPGPWLPVTAFGHSLTQQMFVWCLFRSRSYFRHPGRSEADSSCPWAFSIMPRMSRCSKLICTFFQNEYFAQWTSALWNWLSPSGNLSHETTAESHLLSKYCGRKHKAIKISIGMNFSNMGCWGTEFRTSL